MDHTLRSLVFSFAHGGWTIPLMPCADIYRHRSYIVQTIASSLALTPLHVTTTYVSANYTKDVYKHYYVLPNTIV